MISESKQPFIVRPMTKEDISVVLHITGSLKKFFPQNSLPILRELLKTNPAIVGTTGEAIAGFLVYTLRDRATAEILWMGVKEEYHGLGLGTHLLDTLESILRERSIQKLLTSTLSYTVPYKPYEKVRTFYYRRGFRSIAMERNFYEEGLDRLILYKDLSAKQSKAL
jgi:ribosomal protein S18 acetylase RimI-like enzyme